MPNSQRDRLAKQAAQLDKRLESNDTPESGLSRDLDSRLRHYQRRAVQHLWEYPRSALFLEMGL